MYKKLVATFFIFAFVLGLSSNLVLAKKSDEKKDHEIPEIEGTYDVPGRPDMKVRVFVHNPKGKPPKPSPSPSSSPSPTPTPPSSGCVVDDPPSEAKVDPAGWHLPGTWTYSLNPGSVPSSVGSSSNLEKMATDAFSRWSAAIGGKVNFVQGLPTTSSRQAYDGKNIIAWGRAPGTALAITYTWYYTSNNQVAEVDTIMNQKFPWSWVAYSDDVCVNPDTYDAQDILTHELGHWVGLDDMYTADHQNATMYGYGAKGEIKKDTLTNGDIAGTAAIHY